ncbi:MAG: iron-sulfur cluster assembly scaffold protein [Elusimicrobiota bacterium]
MSSMYNNIVLDHFQNPRNLQEMPNATAFGMGASPICGDILTLYLLIEKGKISKATYKTMGCGAAIASGSLLTELLKGKTVEEATAMTPDFLVKQLGGLPAIKMHCPELTIEALQSALKNLKKM